MVIGRRESILDAGGGQTIQAGPDHAPRPSPGDSTTHREPPPVYAGFDALAAGRSGTLAIVGDTQRSSRWELLWRDHDLEQRTLFADIARRRPDGVVNLGDLVTWGPGRRSWRHFDDVHRALHAAGVPLLPVMGNHDYMPTRGGAKPHLAHRFPHLEGRRWYSFRWSGLAFVALDSNFRALGRPAAAAQDRWLDETLDALERAADVRAIIALWHHPPFTNSRIVRPSRAAERRFAEPIVASSKAVAVFNGHCHAYERFERGGVHFIVSGGGGGPLQLVEHRPQRRRFEDRFAWRWPLRFLNYCLIHSTPTGPHLDVLRLVDAALPLERVERVPLRRVGAATG